MKPIQKALLLITLLIILVGVASASEVSTDTSTDTIETVAAHTTNTVSQKDIITKENNLDNFKTSTHTKKEEETNKTINKKKNTDVKKEDPTIQNWQDLQREVSTASSQSENVTLTLGQGTYENTGTITWTKTGIVLTIDGNGQTINGNQQKAFNIEMDASLVLKNIIITNSSYDYGGAIYNHYGTVTITNSTLQNNNATYGGGAIYNYHGIITIINSTLQNNNATRVGGAIYNDDGIVTISNSTLQNNNATTGGGVIRSSSGTLTIINSTLQNNNATRWGGAIYLTGTSSSAMFLNVTGCNFTENKATRSAAIYCGNRDVNVNITYNNFIRNTASGNKETLDLNGERKLEGNNYTSTDISLTTKKLTIKDEKSDFEVGEDIILNYTIALTRTANYDSDILDRLEDITLYINGEENRTTKYENTTLSNLKPGKYEAYFTTCNSESNTVTFKVLGDSQITTSEDSYDYYDGIKNNVTLNINDPSGEKGTVIVSVKKDDEYVELLSFLDVSDGYDFNTETLADALKKVDENLDDSYTINLTYSSDCAHPSSCEFTLNMVKLRNTSIVYDILNNTQGNVQINITVIDTIYKTPLNDADIRITDDITLDTNSGVITDNTLTTGTHTIHVEFPENGEYKTSNTTITFNVEIDKDKKISELEENITDLTRQLEQANNKIQTLNNTNKELTQKLREASNLINTLNDTNNDLKNEINELDDKINNITRQVEEAKKIIDALNKYIEELLNKKILNTTITINPVKSSVGLTVNLTANIKDENNKAVKQGKVIFKINGKTLKDERGNNLYAMVSDGKAILSCKVQSVWMKNTTTVQAVYGANDEYASSRANASNILNISKGTATITLEKNTITSKAGETITLRAKVLDASGDRISNDKVVFKLNGKTLKDEHGNALYARVVDGEAVLDYTIPSGYGAKTYNLTAVFGGNYYLRTETSSKLVLKRKGVTINTDSIKTVNGKTHIRATITDETGNLLVSSTKLCIKVNKKTVLSNINSTLGKIDVSFTTTLRPGMYELLIISGENGLYYSSKMTTVLKV